MKDAVSCQIAAAFPSMPAARTSRRGGLAAPEPSLQKGADERPYVACPRGTVPKRSHLNVCVPEAAKDAQPPLH